MGTELRIKGKCDYLFRTAKGSNKDIAIRCRMGYFALKTLYHDIFYDKNLIGWIKFSLEVINEVELKIRIMFESKASGAL